MCRPPSMPVTLLTLGYHAYAMRREKFIGPPLCEVPAGPFLMGSDQEYDTHARKDEVPTTYGCALRHLSLPSFP